NPWVYGQALEWATTSPPPHHNFHWIPPIRSERPTWDMNFGEPDRTAEVAGPARHADIDKPVTG
ncbi:MAG: cytochrome ubiquinol oxidase subunit I, partial [Acidimicrobiales bacterium]